MPKDGTFMACMQRDYRQALLNFRHQVCYARRLMFDWVSRSDHQRMQAPLRHRRYLLVLLAYYASIVLRGLGWADSYESVLKQEEVKDGTIVVRPLSVDDLAEATDILTQVHPFAATA